MLKRDQFTSTQASVVLNLRQADRYVNGARLVWPKLDFRRAELVALGVLSLESGLHAGATLQIGGNPHKLVKIHDDGKLMVRCRVSTSRSD